MEDDIEKAVNFTKSYFGPIEFHDANQEPMSDELKKTSFYLNYIAWIFGGSESRTLNFIQLHSLFPSFINFTAGIIEKSAAQIYPQDDYGTTKTVIQSNELPLKNESYSKSVFKQSLVSLLNMSSVEDCKLPLASHSSLLSALTPFIFPTNQTTAPYFELSAHILINILSNKEAATKICEYNGCGVLGRIFELIYPPPSSSFKISKFQLEIPLMILHNLAQVPDIRLRMFAEPAPYILKISSFLNADKGNSDSVRFHSAKIIKSSLLQLSVFETDFWVQNSSNTQRFVNLDDFIASIFYPLAGNDEFSEEENEKLPLDLQFLPISKNREHLTHIRTLLITSIALIASVPKGRFILREKGIYPILRELHKIEVPDSLNATLIERIVSSLILIDEDESIQTDLFNFYNEAEEPIVRTINSKDELEKLCGSATDSELSHFIMDSNGNGEAEAKKSKFID